MKLREAEYRGDKFDIHNNRFVLFDNKERVLNCWAVKNLPDYLDLEVLEVKEGGYQSYTYFVGFATTHIKLNICNDKLLDRFTRVNFGGIEEDHGF